MRITMIGSGYVGLVSGACLADFGHDIVCVDKDEPKIAALLKGQIPIYEPGLDDLVADNVKAGRLSFTTDLAKGIEDAEVIFIAVGTPARRGDGHADLSFVYEAARSIAPLIRRFTVVVTKSTVPVGTGDEIEKIINEVNPSADVAVVSNPEFLREGAAIDDFRRPDRIVIGLSDERATEVMTEVYRPLYLNQAPLLFTGRRTAELIKYAGNAFLAMKITFINEIADLCEQTGANVQQVAQGIGLDKRIGSKFLHAGPGYGGSCFPKGYGGARQDRAGLRQPAAADRDHCRGEYRAQALHRAQGRRCLRRQRQRPQDRDPRPDVQAEHRRHARIALACHHPGAAGCRRAAFPPTIRRAWPTLAGCLKTSALEPTPTIRRRMRMHS